MDSYDEIPYQSTPFHETHPEFLAPLVRLFGLEAAPAQRCRVLELGCASGGNLIPMAWHLPDSEFLGIELSATQAADGARLVQRLGLRNVTIRQGDLLDFDPGAARFDYIIAHGIYSWAPPAVRERILALCREALADHGVAYISYNTLPGWRMRGMLRDMLLYHTRGIAEPARRLAAAQVYLDQLEPALGDLGALSAQYLGHEIKRIRGNHPSYLFHEYLEAINEPFLFSDFVADAARHGLRYVCDSELHTLFPSTLGDAAAALLNGFPDNIALWQHMDFLVNRNFRQSLLCRQERAVEEDPDLGQFMGYAFYSALRPPKKLDLRKAKGAPFRAVDGSEREVFHPLTKAALARLWEVYPGSLAYAELAGFAAGAVRAAGNPAAAAESDHLASELFGLYAHQAVGATLAPQAVASAVGERPRASTLARVQAEVDGSHTATLRHASLQLDLFGVRLLALLDGSRTLAEVKAALCAEAPLFLGREAAPGSREERAIGENAERLLELFARQGVLVG